MKSVITKWLKERTGTPGVLACGVQFPDASSCSQSHSPQFSPPVLEHTWRCVADTFQVLKLQQHFPATRLRWIYEHAYLYCAQREDGLCLGVFTAKDPAALDTGALEQLLGEFQGLKA